ncbi:hypothetical protein GE21DRAFT_6911 [Neurospora crassa]|uniref:Uncharacterized protein n=4 Tax=Neurospora TaxID=5140 RepID=Q7S1T1_NEUCR|nr:uncharacterized protein NEUTE1DRAFT_77694 [Neurospora tetrasperma FGSC 2508]XP_958540.1 hypothetical protein NCU07747 [Neurospora crassa OR74A]EGZ74361.1 hypothetical protein NEUTE2DRAFT_103078 [Neurospora tetrasperma FGSC 2509]KAK3498860.1 hypothetical protein B0T23DRAFT_424404 [Neurospora hispaniola]KAK3501997.1 hypothetical protein B0T13DRAFT_447063 [Neurospora crassa]EAA29304.1 hypothetical protein NCU07747 [Neurospora crassa OR74A]EGO61597.1 hypothetical protein NEUTE1DRAFT_77694 [Neu|eukprot:XP_958540.1 hypothetical protein NCU07747 [Neurospora crassa OR74A]
MSTSFDSADSSRPMMAPTTQNRASVRLSRAASMAPSVAPTFSTTDTAVAQIVDIGKGLERMENKALTQQRVQLSEEKSVNLQKLALGAKLERALDRRMSGQDAVMRPRKPTITAASSVISEKERVEAI